MTNTHLSGLLLDTVRGTPGVLSGRVDKREANEGEN